MIPKIIHQTWKNDDIPEEYISYQQRVKELHPDWEYKLWTDENNLEFVSEYFPSFYQTYIDFPKNIMRADVIRYLIMYKIGGLYLDLDYEMLKPFDILEYDLVLPFNRNIDFGDKFNAIGNCIFASNSGHEFWELAIKDLQSIKNYENYFKSLSDKPYITKQTTLIEAITGPAFLTRVFYDNENRLTNYILPERAKFHPLNPRTKKEYQNLIVEGNTYGIHHCLGSWRQKTFLKKGLHTFKTLLKSRK